MSAPDTNVEKQKRQHRAPLIGIWASLAVVALLFIGWVMFYAVSPDGNEAGGPVMKTEQPASN